MRWHPKTTYSVGDTREVVQFAWLPRDIGDNTTIWLEFYTSVQELCYDDSTHTEYWFEVDGKVHDYYC